MFTLPHSFLTFHCCAVGKLIKGYGAGWEEDVKSLLKSDMKSLTQDEEGSTMTMQQRVIQSGNKSI